MGWRERAEALFFVEKKSILEIEALTGVSRKSISACLRAQPGYRKERERRKLSNAVRRVDYKRDWDREHRAQPSFDAGPVTQDTMRREHDVAALVLSREKYG